MSSALRDGKRYGRDDRHWIIGCSMFGDVLGFIYAELKIRDFVVDTKVQVSVGKIAYTAIFISFGSV